MTALLEMETALSKDELREIRKHKIASMTREEQREMLNEVADRAVKQLCDEFTRQQIERYKQSDDYKEYLKRKQNEKITE